MPNEPRLQVKDLVLTCAEPQYRSAQEATPRSLTISTMNASAGTFVAAALTSAHVGCYVIPEDGNIRGNPRQITKVVLATTTATVDVPWDSSTGVTVLRSWQPSEVPVRSTATGSTTAATSSPHAAVTNEPDAYWAAKGYYLLGKTPGTSNVAGVFKVNSFTQSTGVFDVTGDSFAGAPADGDLFLLRKLLRPEAPVTVTVDRKTISRRIVGFRAADQAVPITADGSLEMMIAQRPLTASAGNATPAVQPFEIGELLADFMTEQLDTGSTVSSAGAGTLTPAGGTFNVGGFVLLATGEASQIEASSGGVLTVPQLVTTPTTSSVVYASSWYQMKQSDFRTRTFDIYRGRIERQVLHGCAPTVELQISRDQIIKFAFKYTAGEAWEYNTGDPNTLANHKFGLLDAGVPIDGKGARVMLNGVRVLIGDLKVTFGPKPVLRPCLSGANQYDGMAFDFEPVKVSITGYLADNDDTASVKDLHDVLETGNPVRFFYQKGSNPKETFCMSIPALGITKATFAHENAEGAFSITGEAVQPQAARGNSASALLPDFAMGWL